MTCTNLLTGQLSGSRITETVKTVADLVGYWAEPDAVTDAAQIVYRTQTFWAAEDGTPGAVLWGNTQLMPGRVGREFFMTRGHRHLKPTHGELCVTVSGRGVLLLMDEHRQSFTEEMSPGSTHWIDGRLAHRTINTGDEPLIFLCAWPADCGHDYDEITRLGFSHRVLV
ncbi:MAG TPA: glucose-6-phosphate isomerase family protein [Fimbriimonadaceae bacterium]|nr:glucose-6-phosphate isomerase family protein [Fimbriimonadaceae bacterium]